MRKFVWRLIPLTITAVVAIFWQRSRLRQRCPDCKVKVMENYSEWHKCPNCHYVTPKQRSALSTFISMTQPSEMVTRSSSQSKPRCGIFSPEELYQ